MNSLKSIWRKMTVKDVIIVFLFLMVSYMSTFIYQSEYILHKLIYENERLQQENDRYSHILDISTDMLQKQLRQSGDESFEPKLRDPFRPDHPTREEAETLK